MNTYSYEELVVGMQCSFETCITQKMMNQFMEITGDRNPLHNDEKFAIKKGYRGRVAYGMLTASFMSTVAGMYLPGEKSLIHQVEGKFLKPVYVEEPLTVCGEIKEKYDLFRMIEVRVVIYNQDNEKVYKGKMKVEVMGE